MLKKIIAFFLRKRIMIFLIKSGYNQNFIEINKAVDYIISGKMPE